MIFSRLDVLCFGNQVKGPKDPLLLSPPRYVLLAENLLQEDRNDN